MAVSGGPDSMALLHLLLGVADSLDLRLVAAHFDHGLRAASAAEADRVCGWIDAAGVECRSGRPAEPLSPRQEELRRARYAFLHRIAREEDASRIATGHQADDQAETILFRILRGTGVRGLGGIPARRGAIVRPLLPFRRRSLEAYLRERRIAFLVDPSNLDPRWERARLRTRVLPALEASWEGPVRERLLELGRAARRADRALEARARFLLERCRLEGVAPDRWKSGAEALDLDRLRGLDREGLARVVRRVARTAGVRLTKGGTRAAVEFISGGRSGGKVDLGGGLVAAREFRVVWIGRPAEAAPDTTLTIDGPEPGRGRISLGGRPVIVAWEPGREPIALRARVELALERIAFPLVVRGWRAGDRIRTDAGTRKLKKLFGERRVPRSARRQVPVVASADGRVVAVDGLAVDPGLWPDAAEERLVLRIEDA
ncbi:MAG: tRNA lysidine(34) synthetase TilS [Candidatus Palauibacterales bacterium]|nr:tRNA lysidine(34) synthetase TilS [Candidatus Palauibacterales bacterium]MDP2530766.1 tRNA lysidine(34) synthetase TilS [Candidatus Palauibacterales bacterium]